MEHEFGIDLWTSFKPKKHLKDCSWLVLRRVGMNLSTFNDNWSDVKTKQAIQTKILRGIEKLIWLKSPENKSKTASHVKQLSWKH